MASCHCPSNINRGCGKTTCKVEWSEYKDTPTLENKTQSIILTVNTQEVIEFPPETHKFTKLEIKMHSGQTLVTQNPNPKHPLIKFIYDGNRKQAEIRFKGI